MSDPTPSTSKEPGGPSETGQGKLGRMALSLGLVAALALIGGALALVYRGVTDFAAPVGAAATTADAGPSFSPLQAAFDPPRPEDAPEEIRDAVMLGYRIMIDTRRYAEDYVGNDLDCRSCHFNGGREKNTLSLVGVAAKYPKYRERSGYATDLVTRTQGCFQRSMNGKSLPPEGKLMQALMAYYHWISKGVPIYAEIPWLGLSPIDKQGEPSAERGAEVHAAVCSRCHGNDGHGTLIAPALWGPGSFNDGAGMHKLHNFSAFAYRFMPKGNPMLTRTQAWDVAAFATGKPRPRFTSGGSEK